MTLDELTAHIGKHSPGPWYTWSDWWGVLINVVAILYLMRGKDQGTLDDFMDKNFGLGSAVRKQIQERVK